MVFPRYKAVIFVNGCFWHGHTCHLFRMPSSRIEYWENKISATGKRDRTNFEALDKLGWRILTVWECALKGKTRLPLDHVVGRTSSWLLLGSSHMELRGFDEETSWSGSQAQVS